MRRGAPRSTRDKLPGWSGDSHSQEGPEAATIMVMPSKQAVTAPVQRSKRFGERLLADGLISEAQLQRALDAQRLTGYLLGAVLLSLGLLDEDSLTAVLG